MKNPTFLKYTYLPASICGLLLFLSIPATYAGNIQDALNSVKSDYDHDLSLIIGWFCDQLAKVVTFGASTEVNVPAETITKNKLSCGGFGTISITQLDVTALRRLETKLIDTVQTTFLPAQFPFISFLAYGKYGISPGIDIGVKLGGLNIDDKTSNLAIKNNVLGIESRVQMLKRPESTFNLVGTLAVNNVDGYIELKSTGSTSASITQIDGVNYNQINTGTTGFNTTWNFNSIVLRGVASTELWIFHPFIGLQIDLNLGKADGKFNASGNIKLTQVNNPSNTDQGSFNFTGTDTSTLPVVNLRFILGGELNLSFIRLGISSELTGDNFSTTLGLRFLF